MTPADIWKAMRYRHACRSEWLNVAATGCDRATSLALLHLGVAFTCDSCHFTYYGGPAGVHLIPGADGPCPLLYCARCWIPPNPFKEPPR